MAGVSDTLWRSVSCSPPAAGHTETAALHAAAIGLTTAAAGNIHFWLDIGATLARQPAAHAAKYDMQTEALVSSQQLRRQTARAALSSLQKRYNFPAATMGVCRTPRGHTALSRAASDCCLTEN